MTTTEQFTTVRSEELRIMGYRPCTAPDGVAAMAKARPGGSFTVEDAAGRIGIIGAEEFDRDWVLDPIEGANNMGLSEDLWVAVATAVRGGAPELFTGDVADFPDLIPANIFQAIHDAGYRLEAVQPTALVEPAAIIEASEEDHASTD